MVQYFCKCNEVGVPKRRSNTLTSFTKSCGQREIRIIIKQHFKIKKGNKEMEKMKVVKLLATQSGVSQQTGNPWKSRDVILEAVQNAVHPDRYVARLFGDAVDKFTAKEGDVLGVALYHKVEEYNGRYFGKTSIVDFEEIK